MLLSVRKHVSVDGTVLNYTKALLDLIFSVYLGFQSVPGTNREDA